MKYEFIMPIMRKYSFNNNKRYVGPTPTDEIFGSDDGFALFLNGMGFRSGFKMQNEVFLAKLHEVCFTRLLAIAIVVFDIDFNFFLNPYWNSC